MDNDPAVFVVDDDEQARNSVCALVQSMGLRAVPFASAEEFLENCPERRRGCVVTDLRMPGMSGLELQEALNRRKISLPVIVLTAYARTPTTVRSMKAGAVTILDKPYADDDLWDAIRAALAQAADRWTEQVGREDIRRRLSLLQPSERKVLEGILRGDPNKVIARDLDLSVRTIENRRREIFRKMRADSVADLIRLTMEAKTEE
jgi:two-component system, LuxR family, response regulator FixJ